MKLKCIKLELNNHELLNSEWEGNGEGYENYGLSIGEYYYPLAHYKNIRTGYSFYLIYTDKPWRVPCSLFEVIDNKYPENWVYIENYNSMFKEMWSIPELSNRSFYDSLMIDRNAKLFYILESRQKDLIDAEKGIFNFKYKIINKFLDLNGQKVLAKKNILFKENIFNRNIFILTLADKILVSNNKSNSYIDKSIGAKINGNIEVGFFIHVEDGYLRKIEGYTFSEDWPEEIDSVEFFEIKDK